MQQTTDSTDYRSVMLTLIYSHIYNLRIKQSACVPHPHTISDTSAAPTVFCVLP